VEIEPCFYLRINGVSATSRQLDALVAVHQKGSQNRAAESLAISVPVLHRHLSQLQERAGTKLIHTSKTGTRLTREGRAVIREYQALRGRTRGGKSFLVGCSIVTEDLLLLSLSSLGDGYDLIISDDERNLKDFRAGLMDMVIVDDPLWVYEMEDAIWEEVAEDYLVHVDRGSRYLRFKYGAQRIGFRHLESVGKEYSIEGTMRSLPLMVRSSYSFFVNHSLMARKGYKLRTATDPSLLTHKILAMMTERTKEAERLLGELKTRRI
jgi:molybdenum-dependent DNA-binding transcriptional regulator ModE